MEHIQIELADRCFGDGIGRRVPPGGADQLRHEQLVDVRMSLPDLVKRLLEDFKGIRDPVREPERAAELERDSAAPRRIGEELETRAQVVGRRRTVRPPFRNAELDEHLRAHSGLDLLLDCAREIPDRGFGRALGERALTRLAKRRDHEPVGLRGDAEQVPRRTLRQRAGLEQQLSGRAVGGVSFHHVQGLVDGAAHDRVKELERILPPKEVKPNEGGRGRPKLDHSTPASSAAWRSSVPSPRIEAARSRASASGGRRARRSPTARETPCAPISSRWGACSAVGLVPSRATASSTAPTKSGFPPVAASRAAQKASSGFRPCSSPASTAIEARPSGSGRIAVASGSAISSATRVGSRPSPSGGRVPSYDEERHSLEPSRQVEKPPQRGGIRPVQVVDREQRRQLEGHVGGEPVEAVQDREGALCGHIL